MSRSIAVSDVRRSRILAVAVGLGFVAVNLPGVFVHPVGFFDEGARLAGADFASRGLLLFRDYSSPYGPGRDFLGAILNWLGLDSVLANRLLFFLVGALVAAMISYLIARRRGLLAGGFMGVLCTAFLLTDSGYGEHFTLILLATTAALILLEESRIRSGEPPLARAGGASSDRVVLIAGSLIALAAWFRLEFGLLVLLWLLLVMTRRSPDSSGRWLFRRWMLIPVGVAAAPYVVIVIAGGLGHMLESVGYALNEYGDYRAKSPPFGRFQFVRDIIGSGSLDRDVFLVALSSTAVLVIPLLLIDRALTPIQRLRRFRLFERDESRLWLFVTGVAVLFWYVTRVRADIFHLTQLVVPLWLALIWSPNRLGWLNRAAGTGIAVATVVVTGFFGVSRWAKVPEVIRTEQSISRFENVAVDPGLAADLFAIENAWAAGGSPDPVFVANRSNTVTGLNAPVVYYVLGVDPPTWITVFDPGFADQERQHAAMIDGLCMSRAPVVLMGVPQLGGLSGLEFSSDLDRFLALNYDLVLKTDIFDYRSMRPSDCVRIDEITASADLNERLSELFDAEDRDYVEVLTRWQQDIGQ